MSILKILVIIAALYMTWKIGVAIASVVLVVIAIYAVISLVKSLL